MRYKADINSMDTLRKVVMHLPPHIQAKWAEESSKLIEADIEPEFSHLTDFVKKRATVANTAFGKLVGTRPNEDKGFTQRARRKSDDAHSVKVTTLATQGSNGTLTIPSPQKALGWKQHANQQDLATTCLFCNGNHNLERCFKFRDKSFEERRKFVLDKRLCVNCLRVNHFVRRCRQFRACLFSGCGKRHHSLLHPPGEISSGYIEAWNTEIDAQLGKADCEVEKAHTWIKDRKREAQAIAQEQLKFHKTKLEMQAEIQTAPHPQQAKTPSVDVQAKLLKLVITKFDRSFMDWLQFWGQFSETIDKTSVAAITKLSYLRELLDTKACAQSKHCPSRPKDTIGRRVSC